MKKTTCYIFLLLLFSCNDIEYYRTFPKSLDYQISNIAMGSDYILFDAYLNDYILSGDYQCGIMLGIDEQLQDVKKYLLEDSSNFYFNDFKIDELEANVTYFYCFFITDGNNILQSPIGSFQTLKSLLPTVGDIVIKNIPEMIFQSTVVSDGGCNIQSVGFCFAPRYSVTPTINGERKIVTLSEDGLFSIGLVDLGYMEGFIRAFVINDKGISYSNTIPFVGLN